MATKTRFGLLNQLLADFVTQDVSEIKPVLLQQMEQYDGIILRVATIVHVMHHPCSLVTASLVIRTDKSSH
ncbi:hypothetical protein XENTR_v10014823 [Xenopus tropicalis]|nr:hypothetical protein XENTR_v10014823 [Xenopus tropicalis]